MEKPEEEKQFINPADDACPNCGNTPYDWLGTCEQCGYQRHKSSEPHLSEITVKKMIAHIQTHRYPAPATEEHSELWADRHDRLDRILQAMPTGEIQLFCERHGIDWDDPEYWAPTWKKAHDQIMRKSLGEIDWLIHRLIDPTEQDDWKDLEESN